MDGLFVAPGRMVAFDEPLFLFPGQEIYAPRTIEEGQYVVRVVVDGVLTRTVRAPLHPTPVPIAAPALQSVPLEPAPEATFAPQALEAPPSSPPVRLVRVQQPPNDLAERQASGDLLRALWALLWPVLCYFRLHAWRTYRKVMIDPNPGELGPSQLIAARQRCARCNKERSIVR
jgi:hypothetical protein